MASFQSLSNVKMESENEMIASNNNNESRVVELLKNAIFATDASDKVSYLSQAQEFAIHHFESAGNFLDEILSFQSDPHAEVRKQVASFIEMVCKREPNHFPLLCTNLHMLLSDEVPNVLKKAIQVSIQLYRVFLSWCAQRSTNDEIEASWKTWRQIKQYIAEMMDAADNDGVRTQCIKFVENVIICQTHKDAYTTDENGFSADQLINSPNTLISLEELHTEAMRLFEQLINFQAILHISSVNLMATMQSLSLLARQRSELFFTKTLDAFEQLSCSLPPTLAKSQVNSVNKQLKLLTFALFKHPYAVTHNVQPRIWPLLQKLGTTQSEVYRSVPELKKRGIKLDTWPTNGGEFGSKRIKLDVEDGRLDTPSTTLSSAQQQLQASTTVDKEFNFQYDQAFREFSKKFSRTDALRVKEKTDRELNARLSDLSTVTELVFASLANLPEGGNKMLDEDLKQWPGRQVNLSEVVQKLSLQLTSAGVGPAFDELVTKYTTMFMNCYPQIKQSEKETRIRIQSLIRKLVAKEIKKYETHQLKSRHAQSSGRSTKPLKQLNILETAKPLDLANKLKLVEQAIHRLIDTERHQLLSAKQIELQNKLLGELLIEFGDISRFKCIILEYVLADIRARFDVLLNMVYHQFLALKKATSDHLTAATRAYDQSLCWAIDAVCNGCCDRKDREFFLQKLYYESPVLTSASIAWLKTFCLSTVTVKTTTTETSIEQNEGSSNFAVSLTKFLIENRHKHRVKLLQQVLLQVCFEAEHEPLHEEALDAIKTLYSQYDGKLSLKGPIEECAIAHLRSLPNVECPSTSDGVAAKNKQQKTIRRCMAIFLTLLPLNHALLHQLPPVYEASADATKRIIMRLPQFQRSIQSIDMNSREILRFVESCTPKTETLVSRVITIVTEKRPPSMLLVSRVKSLYQKYVFDVRFLIPVLAGFNKKEIISFLPQLIKLHPFTVKEVFNRLLSPTNVDSAGNNSSFGSPISPADLMIALHNIDPSKCDLKTVLKATILCFEQKNIYTAEVLAVVMQQLIEQNPLPTLLMRTVIETLTAYPRLSTFVLNNILQRLIVKQVWRHQRVWEGFVKCCVKLRPQSFNVLLQLQQTQLQSVFEMAPDMKPALAEYVRSLAADNKQVVSLSQAMVDFILQSSQQQLQQPQQQQRQLPLSTITSTGTSES